MSKGVILMTSLMTIPVGGLMAQALQPDTLLSTQVQALQALEDENDEDDFSFTESQLDEDVDAAQTIVNTSTSNNDPYLSKVGFTWSSMRFRLRGLDNMYSQSYLNGLAMNDLETGRFNYSMLGGLNDATRNKEGATAFDNNAFGVTGLAGGDNTNLRASVFSQGQKFTLSLCNRNYKYRGMYTFGTGLMNNGWALAGTFGYRGAKEGVIEGTFYNSFSYLLAAEKVMDNHRLSIITFGSPTERAQQTASTEEVYWLANSHYYNPNWGYQDGRKRNARVVKDYEPVLLLSWDWQIDDNSKLSTSTAVKYARYSNSAIGWMGEAYDPRPDYYKNLPSSIFNVYDETKNNESYLEENPYLLDQFYTLKEYWMSDKAHRQLDWDRFYYVNGQNVKEGDGSALYFVERRHNDQLVWALSSTYNRQLTRHQKLTASLQLNATKGMHYNTIDDLLDAEYHLDINKHAASDYGTTSVQAQSDVRHPNRKVKEGDKFGSNYNTYVNRADLWASYLYRKGAWNINASGHVELTAMQREGIYMSGQGLLPLSQIAFEPDPARIVNYGGQQYYDISSGKSGWAKFCGGGLRGQVAWAPIANHRLTVAAGYDKKAPLVRNAFVAPRVHNNYVNNLTLEDAVSAEASWLFTFGPLSGKLAGYYTKIMNAVEQTAFYNDAKSTFTYLTMSDIDREHYGIETALSLKITDNLSVHTMGTLSQALYVNNPYAQLSAEGMSSEDNVKINAWTNPVNGNEEKLRVMADGMHISSTPLTAVNFGVKYNINYWFFEVNANWYDRVFVSFSPYRRLTNIAGNFTNTSINEAGDPVYSVTEQEIRENGAVLFDRSTGEVKRMYGAEQEKCHPGWMVDASVGHSIRLKYGKTMSVNLTLQNITNNTNLRTGGYEQNRDDYYYNTYGTGNGEKGLAKTYKFSKNSKYYYANAFNVFLNVNYKF